jgi:signal transduction histidine kinase
LANGARSGPLRQGEAPIAVFGWAGAIGFLLSTKFLAQPFVWRNWPPDQVMDGWLRVLVDRTVVAMAIALAVVIGQRFSASGTRRRPIMLALAILVGAFAGEGLRIAVDPFAASPDPASIASRVAQWTLIYAAVVGMQACWRLQADYAAVGATAAAADARARRSLLAFELEALQRQIEPHFLFNALATVRRLGRTSPEEGLPLLERLFDYTSRVFAVSQRVESTLGEEIDLALAYLDVCTARMAPRLSVITEIEQEARAGRIPCLMLGTLVENAIKHGLGPKPGPGAVTLRARILEQSLVVEVEDDGVGLVLEAGVGTGISNLTARLQMLYGRAGSLELRPLLPSGVCATLRVPHASLE